MLLQSGLAAAALVQADPLPQRLGELLSAAPDRREALIEALVESGVTADELVERFEDGVAPRPDAPRREALVAGWSAWSAIDAHGVERPYQLYLPAALANGELPTALLVHLHGSVGRDDYGTGLGSTAATGYGALLWPELADELGFALVCPQGRADCAWWTDAGIDHVRATVRDVRRGIAVPDDAIFASGFSDGASGCYALAMLAPDPFCGFIAMNGHPAVASSASGEQLYLENLAARPLIAAMTQRDSLYPSASVLPHLVAAIGAGARVHLISDPDGNHQPVYFDAQRATIAGFLANERRDPSAREMSWWTANARYASNAELELLELGASDRDGAAPASVNVLSTPDRVRLGVQLEPGSLRIASVAAGSLAEALVLRAGDELTALAGVELASVADLRAALARVEFGGRISASALRDGLPRHSECPVPAFVPAPIHRRDLPSAFARVRFESGDDGGSVLRVDAHGVRRLRVWLPTDFAFERALAVEVDGAATDLAPRSASPRELLRRFAATGDASAMRARFVEITR